MNKLWLGAAIVSAVACADSAKKPAPASGEKEPGAVVVENVSAVDSVARQNTNFQPARTPAVIALESFAFDSNRVDSAATYAMSLDELRLARGLVFGRHGRHFADDAFIQAYLQSQSWYKADSSFTNASLNETERANLDVIRGAEAAKHDRIMPGDLRYHRGQTITSAMLGKHTQAEWELLTSEIWAINGHQFYHSGADDFEASYLQEYYDDRYWYQGTRPLRFEDLPAVDRAAIDTIEFAHINDWGQTVTFGMMRLFRTSPLQEKHVRNASLFDLRMMRNEIYALHGRAFTTPWIKRELEAKGYQPNGAFSEAELTQIDKDNIALIRRFEEQRHNELSTDTLEGEGFVRYPLAWVRLLRNELYARHGKIFQDKQLQSYFASMPWYRPNPGFKESMLTGVELLNAKTLLEHEKFIGSGGHYPEG